MDGIPVIIMTAPSITAMVTNIKGQVATQNPGVKHALPTSPRECIPTWKSYHETDLILLAKFPNPATHGPAGIALLSGH